MHFFPPITAILGLNAIVALATTTNGSTDFAAPCYASTLPPTPADASSINRPAPWGTASLVLPNGTTCCDSLSQVRAGIDEIDALLEEAIAVRVGLVREAARFKATLGSIDVPSRDAAVIQEAVEKANSTSPPLPATVAKGVFAAILNYSVPFEECVFVEYGQKSSFS